ncbi:MAG TPA: ISKra4 family transposase, partial [Acetobacteraceae bacterium]|nr:ISKra4 family transposase [Acetobacteraceae bacterium]
MTIELKGAVGTKQTREVARGGGTDPHSPLDPLGLTLDDGKTLLAGVQRHLVQGRVAEYSALRRRCSHSSGLHPLKDARTRRLNSLFGTIEMPAPRFKPCRCAVTARSTLCPASELLPDRCTPEYERTLAKMGAWLPYRCARRFLSEFFPLGADLPWHETIRRRTARVGVGIERKAVSRAKSPRPAAPSETITVSIDAGHVRTARGHQGRTFEVMAAQVSNDDRKPILFSGVPGEADQQDTQLNGVL